MSLGNFLQKLRQALSAASPEPRYDKDVQLLAARNLAAVVDTYIGELKSPRVLEKRIRQLILRFTPTVLLSRSVTPHSRSRLPNVSIPIRGAAEGRNSRQSNRTVSGNMTFSSLLTGRSCDMTTSRSAWVVSARMIGGWMMGTSAMYE